MRIRKGIAIFCLALITLLSAGSFLVFSLLKQQLHSQMHELIRNGSIRKKTTSLSFSSEEIKKLQWLREDEFVLNGEFYDVVESSTNGSNTQLTVICDGKEKKLFEGISVFAFEGKDGKASSSLIKIGKLFSLKYLGHDNLEIVCHHSSTVVFDIPEKELFCSPGIHNTSPPPEFA